MLSDPRLPSITAWGTGGLLVESIPVDVPPEPRRPSVAMWGTIGLLVRIRGPGGF